MGEVLVAGLGLVLAAACVFGLSIYRVIRRDSGAVRSALARVESMRGLGARGVPWSPFVPRPAPAGGASSSSKYSSLSQLDSVGDADPVAEADVYLAYGRDQQAEEVLTEAMRGDPERMAVRTKLLEVYAGRRDTKAFELLARALRSLTQGQGEDWAKAQSLGAQIDPENSLYLPSGDTTGGPGELGEKMEPLGARSTLLQSLRPGRASAADSATVDLDLDLAAVSLDLELRTGRGDAGDPLARTLELAEEFRQIGDMEGARDLMRELIQSAERRLEQLSDPSENPTAPSARRRRERS